MKKPIVIFDMDGTLVDNLPFHHKAFCAFAQRHKKEIPNNDFFIKVNGWGSIETMKLFFGNISTEKAIEYTLEEESLYRELYAPHLKEVEGLTACLNRFKEHGIRMAIGSSAPKENIHFVLDGLNIRPFFETFVCESDVSKTKPDPEIFMTVAQRLNVLPENCIVIEDSLNGILSAQRAKMKVIGITTIHSSTELEHTDGIIPNYNDLTIDSILKLL